MNELRAFFERAIVSRDSVVLNDFLIDLSKNVQEDCLSFLDYFIDNLEELLFEKVKLNLFYVIGEFGANISLDDKYIVFLVDNYYSSDRWTRNEIIQAFSKISNRRSLSNEVIELLGSSLGEEYVPIQKSSLKLLNKIENLPSSVLKKVFFILHSSDSDLLENSGFLLRKHLKNEDSLFDLLNNYETYKTLKKKGVRSLLLIYFKSEMNLESFREKISNSEWDSEYKEVFLNEIDTYQKILLRR